MVQTTSQYVAGIHQKAELLMNEIFPALPDEVESKELQVRFNLKQAVELVGRSEQSIRRAEEAGHIPAPMRRDSGHRAGYTLQDLNAMREHFGTRPSRADTDDAVILGVQNFKGGVGKSTLGIHAAQYFALQGYKVLLVDADPQASSTVMMGINPEREIQINQTLFSFLVGEAASLGGAVRPTHWDGLDLIPSCLALFDSEYIIAAGRNLSAEERFEKLGRGLKQISFAYDIIIVDSPPALGMISLNVVRALNGLVIPTPPSSIDYSSTVSFLAMFQGILEQFEERGFETEFKFVRLLASKVNENKSAHIAMRDAMKTVFGPDLLPTALLDSAEFDNASVDGRTVYEFTGRQTKTYQRCRKNLDKVMGDLELEIRNTWPSHRSQLLQQGVA